jgi:hypothetical protein
MIPEERFGRWTAIGVPLFLLVGIIGSFAIHIGYAVSWAHLFVPAGLFVALQIGAYLGAFWAGKWGRQKKRFWPMALLSGLYLWGAGMIIMHYGARWGILPSFGDSFSFSVCMVFVTMIAWFVAVKFGHKIGGTSLQ